MTYLAGRLYAPGRLKVTWDPSVANEFGVYACPVCKRPLRQEKGVLCCSACSEAYPIREGVPDFIREELSQSMTPY